ncbi:hypothetical protein [Methylobacillus sp.]|uniref:hypothetical protein n=1 Tax=Methylobacillus sp. TaxID=56818 RepID=UPI002FE31889
MLKHVKINLNEIRNLTSDELDKIAAGESMIYKGLVSAYTMQAIRSELEKRQLQEQFDALKKEVAKATKPHRLIWVGAIAAIIGAICGLVALALVISGMLHS